MIDTNAMESFLGDDYASKDIMHGLSHVHRILGLARELGASHPHDPEVLMIAAYCHGVVYSKESDIRSFLARGGMRADLVDKAIKASWESQTDGIPETIEGVLLHDAHLLEGGKTFIITKSLVTGTVRGQTIDQTIRFIEQQVLGRFRCALPEAQAAYEQKEAYARDFLADLKRHLEDNYG
jgi:uncharacterized protein